MAASVKFSNSVLDNCQGNIFINIHDYAEGQFIARVGFFIKQHIEHNALLFVEILGRIVFT